MEINLNEIRAIDEAIREKIKPKENTDLVLGEMLQKMFETGGYRKMINKENASYRDYLQEIGITWSKQDRLRRIYRKYIKTLKINYTQLIGLDTWALDLAISKVNPENIHDVLQFIKIQNRKNIIEYVKKI